MDSFELNKVLGALLGTVFVVFSISLVSDAIFATHSPETPGFAIEVSEEVAGGAAEDVPSGPSALELLASADAAAGEASFRRCTACHTGEEGGANRVGPNLWGIVNRPVASKEGFAYSAGMQAFAEGGTVWDFEHLSGFLQNPRSYVQGTSMSFAGISDPQEEANLIAYLNTLSASPAPLPEVAPAAAEEAPAEDAAAAPAEGEAAPAEGEAAPAEGEAAPADGEAAPAEGQAAPTEGETAAPADAATPSQADPATPTPSTDGSEAGAEPDAGTPAVPPVGQETTPPEGEVIPEDGDQSAAPAEGEQAAAAAEAPAEQVAQAEQPAAAAAPAAEGPGSEALALVATADVAAGEAFFRRCAACHTAEEGGANRVGPNLWDVVNRPVASVEGYNYSAAMQAYAEGGRVWDLPTLSAYLVDPRGTVPGTRMAFAGIPDPQDEANVLAYLRSLSANPAPLQ